MQCTVRFVVRIPILLCSLALQGCLESSNLHRFEPVKVQSTTGPVSILSVVPKAGSSCCKVPIETTEDHEEEEKEDEEEAYAGL